MKALRLRKELEPETEENNFFRCSTFRKVYSFRPSAPAFTKNQKRKQRKLNKTFAASSSPSLGAQSRRYIVDSGASFH